MSVSTLSVPEALVTRRPRIGVTVEEEIRRAKMLAAWCERHSVSRRGKVGVCPCRLGKHPNCLCRCGSQKRWADWRPDHWVDHTETFFRAGRSAIVTTEPYDLPSDRGVVARYLAKECGGIVAFEHPQADSSYFPDRTYLVALVLPDDAMRYECFEPSAKRWVP